MYFIGPTTVHDAVSLTNKSEEIAEKTTTHFNKRDTHSIPQGFSIPTDWYTRFLAARTYPQLYPCFPLPSYLLPYSEPRLVMEESPRRIEPINLAPPNKD